MKRVSNLYFYDQKIAAAMMPSGADYLHISKEDYPVYIKENYLEPGQCDGIVNSLLSRGMSKETTTTGGNLKAERKTLSLRLTEDDEALFYKKIDEEKQEIEKYFGLRITASEAVNALGYPPGGEYRAHCDNCMPLFNSSGNMTGFEHNMPGRVLSTILFLTDGVDEISGENQCVGGNLMFNRFLDRGGEPLLIEPKKGLFIAFPSNPYYQHQVFTVYEGFRVSLVDWHNAEFITKPKFD